MATFKDRIKQRDARLITDKELKEFADKELSRLKHDWSYTESLSTMNRIEREISFVKLYV